MIHENLNSGDSGPKWSVLLTGDYLHGEFERPLAWLDQHCRVTQILSLERARGWLATGESFPDVIVVAQPRPGRYWQAQIEQLHAAAPMSRMAAILGSYCEGETCSGNPCSGVIRVFWHEFVARMEVELAALKKSRGAWSLPRTATDAERIACRCSALPAAAGLIAVGTGSAVVYEGLADACAQAGFSTAWLAPTQHCRIRAAAAGIWDETGRGPRNFQNLKLFSEWLFPAPTLALLGFPRRYECEQAMDAGAADVLPKPFLIDDLLIRLARMVEIHQKPSVEAPAA